MPENRDPTRFAVGMRRGGVVWWSDGRDYVDLMKNPGPVLMVDVSTGGGTGKHADLARILKTATVAEVEGVGYRVAHDLLMERGESTEEWWEALAAAIVHIVSNGVSLEPGK